MLLAARQAGRPREAFVGPVAARLLGTPAHRSAPQPPNVVRIDVNQTGGEPLSWEAQRRLERRATAERLARQNLRRVQSSSAILRLTQLPTPDFVERALLQVAMAPPPTAQPRRAGVPQQVQQHRRAPVAPPCVVPVVEEDSGPVEPPPRPNDRSWQRSVKARLDAIRGEQSRPPLRERLHTSPGFANLSLANQHRMRQLLLAGNPHLYNHAKYAYETRSLAEMVEDIKLAAGASRGRDDEDDDGTDPWEEYCKAEAAAAANPPPPPPPCPTYESVPVPSRIRLR